jgi:hypothetical protein
MMIDELKHVTSMLIELYSLLNHDVAKLNYYYFFRRIYFILFIKLLMCCHNVLVTTQIPYTEDYFFLLDLVGGCWFVWVFQKYHIL